MHPFKPNSFALLRLKTAVVRSVSMKMKKDVEKQSLVGGVHNYKKSVPHRQCYRSTALILGTALRTVWGVVGKSRSYETLSQVRL